MATLPRAVTATLRHCTRPDKLLIIKERYAGIINQVRHLHTLIEAYYHPLQNITSEYVEIREPDIKDKCVTVIGPYSSKEMEVKWTYYNMEKIEKTSRLLDSMYVPVLL